MSKRSVLLMFFLLFGFLPALGLLLLGLYRQTGWYVQNFSDSVTERLGLPVEVTAISNHTPNSGRIRGFTVFQPEILPSGKKKTLAQTPWADWTVYKVLREGKETTVTKWNVPELTLDSKCLEPLWRSNLKLLGDVRQNTSSTGNSEILLIVDGPVNVGIQNSTLELHQAELRIRRGKEGPQTEIHFRVPEAEHEAQITLNLRHIVQNTSQIMQATLVTDTQGISVQYLNMLFPMLNSLGNQCKFTGSIVIQQSFSRWSGVFRGRFEGVNLTAFFPNKELTGIGTLEIEKARFDGAYLMNAEGTLRVVQGTVSRALLQQAQKITQLAVENIPVQEVFPFHELAFRFQVSGTQMQIFGNCSGSVQGTVLTGPNGVRIHEPSFPRTPFSRAVLMEMIQ